MKSWVSYKEQPSWVAWRSCPNGPAMPPEAVSRRAKSGSADAIDAFDGKNARPPIFPFKRMKTRVFKRPRSLSDRSTNCVKNNSVRVLGPFYPPISTIPTQHRTRQKSHIPAAFGPEGGNFQALTPHPLIRGRRKIPSPPVYTSRVLEFRPRPRPINIYRSELGYDSYSAVGCSALSIDVWDDCGTGN